MGDFATGDGTNALLPAEVQRQRADTAWLVTGNTVN